MVSMINYVHLSLSRLGYIIKPFPEAHASFLSSYFFQGKLFSNSNLFCDSFSDNSCTQEPATNLPSGCRGIAF